MVYHSLISHDGKLMLLRVVVSEQDDLMVVVTLYPTPQGRYRRPGWK
jgi:hypothetical protein